MNSSIRLMTARRLALAAAILTSAGMGGAPISAQAEERLQVILDQAKVVKMPANVQTVIIGNPIVADATILKNHSMVLTGKGFGVTNIIALDALGNPVAETTVEVTAAKDKVLVLQLGLDRESYSCAPECMPFVAPGDSTTYMSGAANSITTRNNLASPNANK